jgi:hypothetical protein
MALKHLVAPSLLCLLAGCNVLGKESQVLPGFFGVGDSPSLSLEDDTANALYWKTSTTVLGSRSSVTLSGRCQGGISSVAVKVNSVPKFSTPCSSGNFSAALTGTHAFPSNGVYTLELSGAGTGGVRVSVLRTYDLMALNASTLISLGSVPSNTIDASVAVSGSCLSRLSVNVAGDNFICNASSSFSRNVALSLGSNVIAVSWSDDYGNAASQNFGVTRNPPGATDLTEGMKSASPASALELQNLGAGNPSLAPTLTLTAITGTRTGASNAAIPLSLAPASGATGLRLNTGNHSLVFCERSNPSGECIP